MDDNIRLRIDGMHCAACVRRVNAALSRTPGVRVDSVEVGSAVIKLAAEKDLQTAMEAIKAIGFRAAVSPEA